ncbi:MAG: tetratricopeptide repeat protein [Phycisphaerae bacterium]|nr:tetratricopeptide repeat protein [Phycisphaerae bacterium]
MNRLTARAPLVFSLATLAVALALAPLGCAPRGPVFEPGDSAARLQRATELAAEAQAAEREGFPRRAIDLYEQSIQTYPDFHPAWNNLGVLYAAADRPMDAVSAFRRAADLTPTDPRPFANIGLIYKKRGFEREAQDYLAQALERDDSYLPALRELVWLDVRRGTITERSARYADKALLIERDPKWIEELRRSKIIIDERLASHAESLAS